MAGYSWPAIARIMGRSINACKSEAQRLRLEHITSLESNGGWFTIEDLCDVLGGDRSWVENRIASGELTAHIIGGAPRVSGADLKVALRRYPEIFSKHPLNLVVIFDLYFNRKADV